MDIKCALMLFSVYERIPILKLITVFEVLFASPDKQCY